MKKLYIFIVALLFVKTIFSQEINNRLYFYGGFQISCLELEESSLESGNAFANRSINSKLEIGYEYYFSEKSGMSFNFGYSSLTKYFQYSVDEQTKDSLLANDLTWEEVIRIPNDQHYLSFRLNYVYQFNFTDRYKLSFFLGGLFRFGLYNETYSASNLFYESEGDIFATIGPKSYESFTNYSRFIFNPNSGLRFERNTKYNNSFGFQLELNIPLFKTYIGDIHILPEFEDLKTQFQYYSRGGFFGVTFFYGIGFGKDN